LGYKPTKTVKALTKHSLSIQSNNPAQSNNSGRHLNTIEPAKPVSFQKKRDRRAGMNKNNTFKRGLKEVGKKKKRDITGKKSKETVQREGIKQRFKRKVQRERSSNKGYF
jgi:hypothetical protein